MDPLAASYASISPYHYAGNNPIKNIDIGGMGFVGAYGSWNETGAANTNFDDSEAYKNSASAATGLPTESIHIGNEGGTGDPPTKETESKSENKSVEPSVFGLTQYDVPVWGKIRNAGYCFDNGEYGSCLVWNIIGFAELCTFGLSSEVRLGEAAIKPVVNTIAKEMKFSERLFLSEKFGITSEKFGSSIVKAQGSLNKPGQLLKIGWSSAKNGGGMQLRMGLGSKLANSNQALYHFYLPNTFVPNSFANPSLQIKLSLYKLGLKL